jgi:hypothetical protein
MIKDKSGWETVVRAGFGEFFDIGDAYLEGAVGTGWPYSPTVNYFNIPVPLTAAQAVGPPYTTSYPVNSPLYVSVPNLKLPRT